MRRSISTPALVALVFATILFGVTSIWMTYERMIYKLAFELVVQKWMECEQSVPYSSEPDKEGIEL